MRPGRRNAGGTPFAVLEAVDQEAKEVARDGPGDAIPDRDPVMQITRESA